MPSSKPDHDQSQTSASILPATAASAPVAAGTPQSPSEPPSALDKAAERLAERAEAAQAKADEVADAAQAAAETAEDAEIGGRVRRCPHCRAVLVKHDGDENPFKAGAWHCNACGTCWAPGLRHPRAGTPAPAGWKD